GSGSSRLRRAPGRAHKSLPKAPARRLTTLRTPLPPGAPFAGRLVSSPPHPPPRGGALSRPPAPTPRRVAPPGADYRARVIVRPDVDDEGLQAATDSVRTLVETNGGQVVRQTSWGKRRLAYEVNRIRDGHYVIFNLQLDGSKVAEIERALRIHETVFRHLLT